MFCSDNRIKRNNYIISNFIDDRSLILLAKNSISEGSTQSANKKIFTIIRDYEVVPQVHMNNLYVYVNVIIMIITFVGQHPLSMVQKHARLFYHSIHITR